MVDEPVKRSGEDGGRVSPKPAPPAAPVSPATKAAATKAAARKAEADRNAETDRKAAVPKARKKGEAKPDPRAAARSGNPQKAASAAAASSRYTPPIPQSMKVSPWWVPTLMFGFLAIGMLLIFFNYIEWPFGDPSNWRLLGGLGAILAGIITATQYH
ncbi:MAG: cell division protein CrgA [Acidimicrobiales bacterium]